MCGVQAKSFHGMVLAGGGKHDLAMLRIAEPLHRLHATDPGQINIHEYNIVLPLRGQKIFPTGTLWESGNRLHRKLAAIISGTYANDTPL